MWAVFALGAAFLASFNPILYTRILKEAGPLIVVWVVTLLGLPLLGLFILLLTPRLPNAIPNIRLLKRYAHWPMMSILL